MILVRSLPLYLLIISMMSVLISPAIFGLPASALATSNISNYKSGLLESTQTNVPSAWPGSPNHATLPHIIYSGASQQTSSTAQGAASWTELGPKPITNPTNAFTWGAAPFSGRVAAIAVNSSNPKNIYLGGAQGGVWKTIDGGLTWTPLTDSQPSLAIGALTISPDGKTLYAGTGEPNQSGDSYFGAGLMKSSDGGRSWTVLGSSAFNRAAISGIIVSQSNPSKLIVSTTLGWCCNGAYYYSVNAGLGVFLSSDGGASWTRVLPSPATVGISTLVVDPTNPNIIWAGDFAGSTWRSADGGSSWTQSLHYTQTSLQGRVALAMSPASGSTLFVAFSNSTGGFIGLFQYQYPNAQGTALRNPPNVIAFNRVYSICGRAGHTQCDYDLVLGVDPSNANIIYIGGVELYRSSDGGQTWTDLGGFSTGSLHPDHHALAFSPSDSSTIFVGNDGGLWTSSNRGTTWTDLNSGLSLTQFYSIAVSPFANNVIIGGTQDNGCVRYSGSASWPQLVVGDGGWTGFEASNSNIMYCMYTGLNFQKSVDGGATWSNATTGINLKDKSLFIAPLSHPAVSCLIYIGGTHLYKTTDCASTWSDVSGAAFGSGATITALSAAGSNIVYVGTDGGNVFFSQDGGRSWQTVYSTGQTYSPISSIAVDPTTSTIAYFSVAASGVQKASFQNGAWQVAQLAAPTASTNVIRVNPSNGWLYAGTDVGAYYSSDGGASWALVGLGLPNVAVFDIVITTSGQVVAATHGRGAWSITPGAIQKVTLTLSYGIVGGGAGFSPPTLSYTQNGQPQTAVLGLTPTAFSADTGSTWSVTNPLTGSSTTERWMTNQPAAGTLTTSQTLTLSYYHQYLISAAYSLVGGGTPTPPTFSYTSFGSSASASLAGQQSLWVDIGPYTATNPLVGSTSAERWYAPGAINGTISGAGTINLAYYHQFFLTVNGGNIPSQWYNSGSTATVNPQPVYGRSSGTGFRIASYTIDAGAATVVSPTSGTLSIQIVMNAPHTLNFSSVTQYQVTLDSGAKGSLSFITSPTISSDNYWYDAGSQVKVVLNGTWGRGSGTGNRILSYAANGGAANSVATSGAVTVLSLPSITAPQSLTTTVATQYQLTTASGSVNSTTPPSIAGDMGWYDQGSSVKVEYNYVWNSTANQSRLNAVSYELDGGSKSALPRAGGGTFTVSATMDKPHAIDVFSIMQYHLTVSGGFNTLVTAKSPTNDGFYDSGSTTTVTTEYTWNVIAGKSRENLVSFTLDGQKTNLTRAESGTFMTPGITFDKVHTIAFDSVTQYFVAFNLTDNSGSKSVTPTTIQISLNGRVQNVSRLATWVDKGSTFKIASIVWEHTDVKPSDLAVYTVSMPLNETIRGRIFDAKLSVTDLLGIPISGASAQLTLANGTQFAKSTDSNGAASLGLIPLGTFTGSVSYLGSTTQFSGDASQHAVTTPKVFASYADIGAIGGGIAVAITAIVFKFVIRKRSTPAPAPQA